MCWAPRLQISSAPTSSEFIVENRPERRHHRTNVVVQSVRGYTLLYTSDSIAPTPFVYKSLPYDVFRDLAPIATSACSTAC